jgi:hypothetical protein
MADNKRSYEALKFTFGPSDIQELGQSLARETQNLYDLETRKKEIVKDFGAQLEAAAGRIAMLTQKMNNGYEMREIEVLVLMDEPKPGIKRVIRVDTQEHLRDEVMTLEEKQRSFGFGDPKE